MHEIVTIQCGRSANYLATHFWNAQDAYQTGVQAFDGQDDRMDTTLPINYDVHFRPGFAPDGSETFLPRTLIYDLSRGFGSLARTNVLGGMDDAGEAAAVAWDGQLSRLPMPPPATLSPYTLSLLSSTPHVAPTTATTPFFADFSATYFHPRSLQPLSPPHPHLDPSSTDASAAVPEFSTFAHGAQLFASRDAAEDILDTELRPWIEEADALQAVQLFASLSDPWGGFAARYAEAVRDELPKTCLWVWGIDDTADAISMQTRWDRALNRTHAVTALSSTASMLVPVAVPRTLPPSVIDLQRDSAWHTSALLCAGIESASIPTWTQTTDRLAPSLGDWAALLADNGRRPFASLRYGIPPRTVAAQADGRDPRAVRGVGVGVGIHADPTSRDTDLDADLDIDLLPDLPLSQARPAHRPAHHFARIDCFRGTDPRSALVADSPPSESIVEVYDVPTAFPLTLTFPRLFDAAYAAALPIHTSLATSSSLATWLRALAAPLGGAAAARHALAPDEREALRSELLTHAEAYIAAWESESESEDGGWPL